VGDLLLQEIAKRLRACVRQYDFIARLGGDEFSVIIYDLEDISDAANVAKTILDTLSQLYNLAGHSFSIGCSIGIACYPVAGQDAESLVKNADIAMYHAKELGRNNYQYFTEALSKKQKNQDELRNSLQEAIVKNELFLLYDPIFNLKTKKITGMEALIRWKHPTLGIILPEHFIPLAEELGLTTPLNNWVLHQACVQAKQWLAKDDHHFKLSFNMSYRQLLRKDLLNYIQEVLAATQLPPQFLQLEIESKREINFTHNNLMEKVLNGLAAMDINLVIDDFGIGCDSLIHLKNMPINSLKINDSFVGDVLKNSNDAAIVSAIIALGKQLKLNVIAEGIETVEQFNFLLNNDCPEGQGQYLSAPLDATQILALLTESKQV